ncbi:MAG: response regulator [Salinarimonas sp.]|nr:response regulator [Salinarimonas sp.]
MSTDKTVRVLYIDDDPAFGRLVERALTRQGMEVTYAEGGDAGLTQLADATFDIIALDHFMPGKEGLDVLAEIRAMALAPPVIYVTGADEGRIAVAALKNGAADYIVKDVGGAFFELLGASIRQALKQECVRRAKELAEQEVREQRDRAEMLLREVNHRVANSLQLVASLVTMQKGILPEGPARDALVETQTRISAISQIHRRLYTSNDVRRVELDAYLTGLIEELDQAMRASGTQSAIRVEAESILVPTDQAISLGVIVVELVTNATKYAYPGDATGDIRVLLRHDDSARVELVVEDDGIGFDAAGAPQGSGLGTRIVSAMAANLKTEIHFDPAHSGTRAMLSFDLPQEAAHTGEAAPAA